MYVMIMVKQTRWKGIVYVLYRHKNKNVDFERRCIFLSIFLEDYKHCQQT